VDSIFIEELRLARQSMYV